MALLSTLKERLRGRTDSEHEQAILRIVLVGLITVYMWGRVHAAPAEVSVHDRILLFGLLGFLLVAFGLFAAICASPGKNIPRRIAGMLADSGGTTFALFLANDSGVGLIGVYLFITFGNGFRYGRKYLFLCQALCLAGFVPVVLWAPWWVHQPYIGWGLMASMIVLPLYVSTLLKRIEEARKKAEEANRAKSAFLANMSHEMRTPLNGIVGVTDLLQTTPLNAEQVELMRLQRHSVALLRSLVDDVLDISKIESGRLSIEIAEFDLYAMINNVAKMMRPHAESKELALRCSVDPAIDYHVKGDPHHLRQVLVNLLSNAIKFTERGHVEVGTRLLAETADGFRVRIEVKDTGIGIAQENLPKIFQQFVQADDSITRRYGGTGLGTSIAKQLVELMGGAIGVTSALGAGSTFWFEVPLLRADGAPARQSQPAPATRALLFADAKRAQRLRPLVTEVCGDIEILPDEAGVIARLRTSQGEADGLAAVLVAADVEVAIRVFAAAAEGRAAEDRCALIFIADAALADADHQRLRAIDGVTCLDAAVSPRLLQNALHAAASGDAEPSAEIIDLGVVLKQQRRKLRILVAEDNATNQAIIQQLLESAGHAVFLTRDGEEALDAYELQQPDLAILDFNMPERSGVEVTKAIRQMEPTGVRMPIIILSASVTPETRERVREAGADDFVGKPFDAATFIKAVDELARKGARAARPAVRPLATVSLGGIPLVDQARLREVMQIASDPTFLERLVDGFCSDVETLLARLDTTLVTGQLLAIPDLTHAIRGAAAGIGAQQLAARCIEIDESARRGDRERLPPLVAEMRRCYAATATQLRAAAPGPQLATR
ncbi:MAG: response regulator [Burkholderiales bacterium]|nr:response regulator [Burkholderiales bacterium]